VKTWWSSLFWPRGPGRAFRLIAFNAVGLILFLPWAFYPAAAAGDDLRVIAVNTASAPHVWMVVEPPAEQPDNSATAESCSVTIDEESVACTVTSMASDSLSVALVIDTSSDLTAQELAAVQNGAAEFLVRLPQGAGVAVIGAASEPQVVASLSADRAEALSAITALRAGGSGVAAAGAMVAADSLRSAPPGPHAIVVYAHGADENGPSVEQLSEAALQANAVVNVIPTGADSTWSSVVDRTGGVVLPPTGAADIAQAYRRLATMLDAQYLVTFQVPDDLPLEAQVTFQSGDQEYRTVVDLPDADTSGEAAEQPTGRGSVVLFGLVLLVLVLALVLQVFRTRRGASVASGPPAAAAPPQPRTPPAAAAPPQPRTPPAPVPATPATDKEDGGPQSNGAPSSTPAAAPATSTPQSPSRRRALTAAVQGRRSAEQALNSAPEQQVRQPPEDQQLPAAPDAKPAPQTKDADRP
jgi:hypothetical protein